MTVELAHTQLVRMVAVVVAEVNIHLFKMAEPQLHQAAQTESVMEMQAERVALLLERNQAAAAAEPARLVEMEAQQQVDQVALE
jgi:hypothetical protein